MAVADRQHVVGHLATTLNTKTIALLDSSLEDAICPIGVVVVLVNPIVTWIIRTKELESLQRCTCSTQQVTGIGLELNSIHHTVMTGHQFYANICGSSDACCQRSVTFGVDEDDTVCALSAIKSGSVLKHFNTLDVINVDIGKNIVVEA